MIKSFSVSKWELHLIIIDKLYHKIDIYEQLEKYLGLQTKRFLNPAFLKSFHFSIVFLSFVVSLSNSKCTQTVLPTDLQYASRILFDFLGISCAVYKVVQKEFESM